MRPADWVSSQKIATVPIPRFAIGSLPASDHLIWAIKVKITAASLREFATKLSVIFPFREATFSEGIGSGHDLHSGLRDRCPARDRARFVSGSKVGSTGPQHDRAMVLDGRHPN